MIKAFHIVDFVLFLWMAFSVAYIFIFAVTSLWNRNRFRIKVNSQKINRVLILIPAYMEDNVIMDSVNSAINQNYPKECLQVIVISDKMDDVTNSKLSLLPVKLLKISPERSSKALAMKLAMETVNDDEYDVVIIMDADNTFYEDFVSSVNEKFNLGVKALQAHRVAKNTNNDLSVLDALSEEINNSIFRKGHVNLGLSSALAGSGMAFDFAWFKDNVKKLKTMGEDKEIELLLLKDKIYIDYFDELLVYDAKVEFERTFYNQRRRWVAAQYGALIKGIKWLSESIVELNYDYLDKIVQWMLLPRVVIMGIISVTAVILLIVDWTLSIKWLLLLVCLIFAFILATPHYLRSKKTLKAIKKLPVIYLLMFINLFRIKGADRNFIHTTK